MSSNYVGYGTVTTDVSTDTVACRGWATLSAHLASGTGTWTWEFKGVDGVWRTIYADADFITAMTFSASNMINVFFGTDVSVRGTASAGSTPSWGWQVMSNPSNRD
jgi:hypothetical protein